MTPDPTSEAAGSRDPDRFDPDYYLRANDDVRAHGFDPADHYQRFGRAEGRPANAFQAARRLQRDAARLAMSAPAPRAGASFERGADGRPLAADPTLANRAAVVPQDGAEGGAAEFALAVQDDPVADATAPGWFDADFYQAENRDVRQFEIDPYLHYLEYGFREGRPPNRVMARIGRSVSPRNRSPRLVAETVATIIGSGLFDAPWYGARYGVDPARAVDHYVSTGAFRGYDPSPFFSSLDYVKANADTAKTGANPFAHYIAFGFVENRPGAQTLADTRLTTRIWLKGL